MLRSKHPQEKWPLILVFDILVFDVWHDNVVHIFLIVRWLKPYCRSDLSLLESLKTLRSFKYDVLPINLPESITFGFDSD